MSGLRFRYLGPVVLITLCLVTLCAFTAISLFGQQAEVARVLRDNVESRRAAVELEECLTDLIALENDRVEAVSVLHDRVLLLMKNIRVTANQTEEARLLTQMETSYEQYLKLWRSMPPPRHPDHESARHVATHFLESEVLKPCQEFIQFNAQQIENSAEHHESVLRQLMWGMAVIGGLGAIAGVVLGFGVARGLSRSIRRLQVQIRDAAGKLGPDLPEIVLTEEGDFQRLHAEVDRLSERIEQVVSHLQQREREILRAEQLAAVGQLAAGVGHEIRNPLTSIKMLVQSALEGKGETLTQEDLVVIEAEVRRMERSLQMFLEFAKPPKSEQRVVKLVELIQDVIKLIRGRAEKQQVTIQQVFSELNQTITADPEQLRQVIVNLSLNALDAMPTGGTLKIATRANSKENIELEFLDTGPGVSKTILPKLFEPFVSSKETGLGLGLVISKRIVQEHGGTISATNRRHGGACFVVTLPQG